MIMRPEGWHKIAGFENACDYCGKSIPIYSTRGNHPIKFCPDNYGACRTAGWRIRRRELYAAGVPGRSLDRVRADSFRRRYGITIEDYNRMLAEQDYLCFLCRQPETKRRKDGEIIALSVDHDHGTGRVRRLLCHRCNLAVAGVENCPVEISLILAYIEQYRSKGGQND